MTNAAHFHLLVNHAALFIIPISILFLLMNRDLWARKTALGLIVVGTIMTAVAHKSGESAEHFLESRNQLEETYVEPHEEASEVAMGLSITTGLFALLAFLKPNFRWSYNLVVMAGIATTLSLGYTAYLGGRIQHKEIRSEGLKNPPES